MQVDVSKSTDDIIKQILEKNTSVIDKQKKAIDDAEKVIQEHKSKKELATQAAKEAEESVLALQKEYEKKKRTFDRYTKLYKKAKAARDEVVDQRYQLDRALVRAKASKEGAKSKLESVTYGMKEDILRSRLEALRSISPLIDTSRKIVYGNHKFEWTTTNVKIWDASGFLLPCDFGRFQIVLSTDRSRRLVCSMHALEPNARGSAVHPHVLQGGNACLGNAGAMLLKAVLANDIGMAITVVHEFLTNYNKKSPHEPLSSWIPNRWDHNMCPCGLVVMPLCGCDKCVSCDQEVITDGNNMLVCNPCLESKFVLNEEAAQLKLGIGGSGYVLRSEIQGKCTKLRLKSLCEYTVVRRCNC